MMKAIRFWFPRRRNLWKLSVYSSLKVVEACVLISLLGPVWFLMMDQYLKLCTLVLLAMNVKHAQS